ncbi:hypothetical protein N752_14855 [Desulforamulus aquiferis]|nr:hypothetical protein N752_14855 [Desulforamulus aquiferis]
MVFCQPGWTSWSKYSYAIAERGVLDEEGVILLGTPLDAIRKAEDREMFKLMMEQIGEPVPESTIVCSVREAIEFADSIGYPVIVRPPIPWEVQGEASPKVERN